MDSRKQGEFGNLVVDLFRAREKHPHLMVNILQHHWPAIVGDDLAGKTHPIRIARDTLWINAVDSSWAYQLQFLKGEILQSVRAFLRTETISELRFKMGEVPLTAIPKAAVPAEVHPFPTKGKSLPMDKYPSPHPTIPNEDLGRSFARWLAGQKRRKLAREGEQNP